MAAVAKPSAAGKPATAAKSASAAAATGITGAAAAKPVTTGATSKLATAAGTGKLAAAAAGTATGTAAAKTSAAKTSAVAAAGKRPATAAGNSTAAATGRVSGAAVAKPSAAAAAGKRTAPAAGSTSGTAPAKPHAAVQVASQVVRPTPSSTKVATSPSQGQEDPPVEEVSGHAVDSGAGQKRKVAQTQLSAASISAAKVAKITPTGTPGAQASEAALLVPTDADNATTTGDSGTDRDLTELGEETLVDAVHWTDEGAAAEVAEVHPDTTATDANDDDDESSGAGATLPSDSFAIEDVAGMASVGVEEIGDEDAHASPDEYSPPAKPTHADPLPLPQS